MDESPRDLIADAAFQILSEVGPSRLRVQDVAERAGVSATLLYYYFDGKHALIAAAYAREYHVIAEEDGDVLEALFLDHTDAESFVLAISGLYSGLFSPERRKRRLGVLAAALTDPAIAEEIKPATLRLHTRISDMLHGCVQRGWIRDDTDISSLALMLMSTAVGRVFLDLTPELEDNLPNYIRTAFQVQLTAPLTAD